MKNKEDCDHFWEVIFPDKENKKIYYHKCMKCGTIKETKSPVFIVN